MPLHSPAFLFERTTRSRAGEIVEFVRSIYRGDRYRLVTELNRRPARRGAGNGAAPDQASVGQYQPGAPAVIRLLAGIGAGKSRMNQREYADLARIRVARAMRKVVLTTPDDLCHSSAPWPSGINQ